MLGAHGVVAERREAALEEAQAEADIVGSIGERRIPFAGVGDAGAGLGEGLLGLVGARAEARAAGEGQIEEAA